MTLRKRIKAIKYTPRAYYETTAIGDSNTPWQLTRRVFMKRAGNRLK
jgi:hypothetical protein